MTTPQLVLLALMALFVLWLAYKIGKVLLRLAVGLAVLALLSWGLWRIFHT